MLAYPTLRSHTAFHENYDVHNEFEFAMQNRVYTEL